MLFAQSDLVSPAGRPQTSMLLGQKATEWVEESDVCPVSRIRVGHRAWTLDFAYASIQAIDESGYKPCSLRKFQHLDAVADCVMLFGPRQSISV
jgi:hypothetical protein